MSVRTKILQKGKIVQEQLIRVLIKFDERITTLEQGETGELVDIGALKETVGDEDGGLVKAVADLGTNKADASHNHTLTGVTDLSTVEATVTYTDQSTDTLLLVVQTQSQSQESQGEQMGDYQ